MIKYHYDIEQNTDEWWQIRCGLITASYCSELLMADSCKGYQQLIKKIAEERFTGELCQSKKWQGNMYTNRGHDMESQALTSYEAESLDTVERVGFISRGDKIGCSPDGLIGDDGLIQVKCPIFDTIYNYHTKKTIPADYYKQMQFELYVTGRQYNVFYAWHPNLAPVTIKVEREAKMLGEINNALEQAELKINLLIEQYNDIGRF